MSYLFIKKNEMDLIDWKEYEAEGIKVYPVAGKKAMMVLVEFEEDGGEEVHSHEDEQFGYLIKGNIKWIVKKDGETVEINAEPGDINVFESGQLHGVKNIGNGKAILLEAMSPPPERLLKIAPKVLNE